ncbi:MAG: hypothetical protein IKF91_04805 [Bacilli bacterium]|nr:hypothetical protein [Bacilli bacterium]
MKYLIKNLLIFLLVFIGLKQVIFMFDKGHNINYNIGNFNIKEIYSSNDNNYYFKIKSDKLSINFQIKENYNKSEKIIKKLHYKKIDDYKCLFPLFKENRQLTDIMCMKDNIIYYANTLNNKNIQNYFEKKGYKNKYKDKAKKMSITNTQSIYKDNIKKNTYIAIETYKGLKLFNGKETEVKIFENDVYKKPISIFTHKYYLVADYNSEYTFNKMHLVNIINGEKITIRSYDDISFDSYIMGEVDGKIYMFDKENNKQYEIDLEEKMINHIGNKNNIIFYNGKWTTITLNEAKSEKKFTTFKEVEGYEKVDKINNYYYYYKKENNTYKIYRADKNNKKIKTYLFDTKDITNITYIKDNIYYKNNNILYIYSNNSSKKLISDKEIEFNSDISFGIYEK